MFGNGPECNDPSSFRAQNPLPSPFSLTVYISGIDRRMIDHNPIAAVVASENRAFAALDKARPAQIQQCDILQRPACEHCEGTVVAGIRPHDLRHELFLECLPGASGTVIAERHGCASARELADETCVGRADDENRIRLSPILTKDVGHPRENLVFVSHSLLSADCTWSSQDFGRLDASLKRWRFRPDCVVNFVVHKMRF